MSSGTFTTVMTGPKPATPFPMPSPRSRPERRNAGRESEPLASMSTKRTRRAWLMTFYSTLYTLAYPRIAIRRSWQAASTELLTTKSQRPVTRPVHWRVIPRDRLAPDLARPMANIGAWALAPAGKREASSSQGVAKRRCKSSWYRSMSISFCSLQRSERL